MAIFRCVGYFYFHVSEGFCFAALLITFPFESASNKYTQEATKLTKENSTGTRHRWKHAGCDHAKKKQKRSKAEYFKQMKIKISYTPEDGRGGRKMS
jgi:hypothetical protein